jgi:hypothetical protein
VARKDPFKVYLARAPLERLLRAEHALDEYTSFMRGRRFRSSFWIARTRRLLEAELRRRHR